jgi:AcrR family transcriptional regulator
VVTGGKRRVAGGRRAPVQARSRRRVAEILDGTARLVDEVGPDAVTTTLIAERLGIAVGTIYTYFEDRSAIFDEIVAVTIAANDRLVSELRIDPPTGDWVRNGANVIDRLADAYRSTPGFRALYLSRHVSPAMLDAMRRTDEDQARSALADLVERGYCVDSPVPLDVLRMYVGLVDKGLDLAFRDDPNGNDSLILETKHAVQAYMELYLQPPG